MGAITHEDRGEDAEDGGILAAGGIASGGGCRVARHKRAAVLGKRGSWLMFALLLLAPDLSMLGYIGGPRVGATLYNVFHVYPLPAVLGAFGLLGGSQVALAVALIWFTHIGMGR